MRAQCTKNIWGITIVKRKWKIFILWFPRTGFSVPVLFTCLSMHIDRQEFEVPSQGLQTQQFFPSFENRGLTHSSEKGCKPWYSLGEVSYCDFVAEPTDYANKQRERLIITLYKLSESCALANAPGTSSGTGSAIAYIRMPAAKQVGHNNPFAIFSALNAFEDPCARFMCESSVLTLFVAWLSSGTPPPVTGCLVSCQRLLTAAWRGTWI